MKKLMFSSVFVFMVVLMTGCSSLPESQLNSMNISTINCPVNPSWFFPGTLCYDNDNTVSVFNCTDYFVRIEGSNGLYFPRLSTDRQWRLLANVWSKTPITLVIKVYDPKSETVLKTFSKTIVLEKGGENLYSYVITKEDGEIICTDKHQRIASNYTSYGGGVSVSSNNHRRGWSIFGGNDHHDRGHDNNRREHHR
ncbi:MAG: hypothetical protein WAV11_03195 [Minisyncoccia bacterium]